MRPRAMRMLGTLALATLTPLACGDATDVELLEITATGVLAGQAFLDFDGTGSLTPGDSAAAGVDVVLLTPTTGEVARSATTDTAGVFLLLDVPVGSYVLTVDDAATGDSLEVLGGGDEIAVGVGDTSVVRVGITFPTRTIEQIVGEPVGRRFFTSGIALNERLNVDPTGRVHLAGDSLYLRALGVARSGIVRGDSVRLLGRLVDDNGRRALVGVTPYLLVSGAALTPPVDVGTGMAAAADGGRLDAALVRIRDVDMTDTATALDGHFRFWATAGADSIEVVIRDFLGLNTAAFRPDTIVRLDRADGLLTPVDDGSGDVRWQLLPRGPTDIAFETKLADVRVTASFDRSGASLGDTVEVTVVAENRGPLPATVVEVRDTIPSALTFVSSTETTGTYDSATGIWSVGTIEADVADTLRIRMEVTDGSPTTVPNTAESLGLTFEVDRTPSNDGVVVTLIIS